VHAGLLEAERLRTNDGRVDEVQTEGVGAELADDDGRVGVVLQALTYSSKETASKCNIEATVRVRITAGLQMHAG
jgi:hypothetical protein